MRKQTRLTASAAPRQTERQAIAEAVPSLFVLVQADGNFLRKKHHEYGHLAVVFRSRAVAGQFLSFKSKAFKAQLRLTQLRPTCHEQIASWCKAGKCNGYWLVDARNVQQDYPCDNYAVWATRDPDSGMYVVKGGVQ